MNNTERAEKIIKILRQATKGMVQPAVTQIVNKFGPDPYLILISCLLSLRARDVESLPASLELFTHAKTPKEMLKLPLSLIEKIIYKCGFYRNKAKSLKSVSQELMGRFEGRVPGTFDELTSIKGVGPKTANLVLAQGFGVPAICVDTHVHRISNRLGLVKTTSPEETEVELKKVIPEKYWSEWNQLMVMWGQNICVPISPFVSKCAISGLCPKVGVTRSR